MTTPPNVLLVICDDLGWADPGCHGNPYAQTPTLDRLYRESVRCNRHCSGPLCSPARASLMTGRYHQRTRVIDTYLGRSMMDPSETTLAHCFRAAGYRTGMFGKWHLGDNPPNRPIDLGFEECLMHLAGGIGQPGDLPANRGRDSYFDPMLMHNGTEVTSSGYCSDIFADAAGEWITNGDERPWFSYLGFNAPHSPLHVPDEWLEKFKHLEIPEKWQRLYAMNANLDAAIGRILERLDQTGQRDQTLVIFTSDHGPCGSASSNGIDRPKNGLRGRKGQLYEGGIRVPHWWSLPGTLPAGTSISVPTHPIDVLPTLCAACNLPAPHEQPIDGTSLWPSMTTGAEIEPRQLFMQWHRGDVPVFNRNYAVIEDSYKLTRPHEDEADELYDLAHDPFERDDLATAQPEIVQRLRQDYATWFESIGGHDPANFAPPPIVIDQEGVLLTRNDWRIHGEDGWSDQHFGHWEVHCATARCRRISVRFSSERAGPITLCIDGNQQQVPCTGAVSEPVEVELAAGPHVLSAWDDSSEQRCAALYIEVEPSAAVAMET